MCGWVCDNAVFLRVAAQNLVETQYVSAVWYKDDARVFVC